MMQAPSNRRTRLTSWRTGGRGRCRRRCWRTRERTRTTYSTSPTASRQVVLGSQCLMRVPVILTMEGGMCKEDEEDTRVHIAARLGAV